jgi:hypothetical protein
VALERVSVRSGFVAFIAPRVTIGPPDTARRASQYGIPAETPTAEMLTLFQAPFVAVLDPFARRVPGTPDASP